MLIGLDFGSHHSSLGLWNPETNVVQVFADDMGLRQIPCIVGFRKEEVLVGHSAHVQRHKNSANTFDNIRKLLENESNYEIYIPVLDKSINVLELASHYFRHLHNQVKDQIGKPIKDCVITLPGDASDLLRANIVEAARTGGLKVRSFIPDSIAGVLAHRLDDPSRDHTFAVVVDFGWSKCEVSCLEIVSGVFSPLSSASSNTVSGAFLVDALTKHCAKDFQRRSKIPCTDNTRSMMRLTSECEGAIKILSTSAEAAIDLDSLCEGIDYAGKISRVRFEDLCLTYFMALRELVQSTIAKAISSYSEMSLGEINVESFTQIILGGGFSSVPKIQSILSSLLPNAHILRNRIDPAEALCIGASWHSAVLFQEGLLESSLSSTSSLPIPCCSYDLVISKASSTHKIVAVRAGTPLPIQKKISLNLPNSEENQSSEISLVVSYLMPQNEMKLSQLDFTSLTPDKDYEAEISISVEGGVDVSLRQEGQEIGRSSWKERN